MKTYYRDIVNRLEAMIEQTLTPIPVMSVLSWPKGKVQKLEQNIIFSRNACPAEPVTFSRVKVGSWLRYKSKIALTDSISVRLEQVKSVGPGIVRGLKMGTAAVRIAWNMTTIAYLRREATSRKRKPMIQVGIKNKSKGFKDQTAKNGRNQ